VLSSPLVNVILVPSIVEAPSLGAAAIPAPDSAPRLLSTDPGADSDGLSQTGGPEPIEHSQLIHGAREVKRESVNTTSKHHRNLSGKFYLHFFRTGFVYFCNQSKIICRWYQVPVASSSSSSLSSSKRESSSEAGLSRSSFALKISSERDLFSSSRAFAILAHLSTSTW